MRIENGEAVVSVRFGELWLRGRNRGRYVNMLLLNIAQRLHGEDVEIIKEHDRVLLRPGRRASINEINARLSTVFGISRFETAYATEPDLASIKKLATGIISKLDKGTAVRIRSHRSYKQLGFDSMDVVERLARAARSRGLKLASRDFGGEINVNITRDNAFVSTNSTKGAGGLPVGSGGKAIILLSGGIDSPVAAWYAMKRGMSPVYVHFHGFPNNDAAELKKITDIADSLLRFSLRYRMYTVPASLFQLAALNAGRSETVLLKHFMLLAAERIAGLEGASMVYTGDCLGQVSSQTPQNLFAESQGIRCTIARPLIGFDKEEIIGIARRIGTYELSVLPYMDVCSINSRNPSTAVRSEVVRALAKEKKLRGIAAKSIRSAKIIEK